MGLSSENKNEKHGKGMVNLNKLKFWILINNIVANINFFVEFILAVFIFGYSIKNKNN